MSDLSPICYFDYTYDAKSRITRIDRENGIAIYYGYDKSDRLTGENWYGASGQIYAFSYGYDGAGNRSWKNINSAATYYTYDKAERLLNEVTAGVYTYYAWDHNGSCARVSKPSAAEHTYYEYNDERLLRRAHVLPSDVWNYFYYDGQLTRYCIQDSLGVQYYYWDGLKLLERYNVTTATARTFTHGPTPIPGIANMLQFTEGGATYCFAYDDRGSAHAVSDASQGLPLTYKYDAYGVDLGHTGALENPIQYQGCA